MSNTEDSEDETQIANYVETDTEKNSDDNVSPNKLISITTSLNNLSLSQNDIENYSN